MQGSLTIEQMCYISQVSRASFYRSLREKAPSEEEMAVRSRIQTIWSEHKKRYGYRRITAQLRNEGLCVNHKRVAQLMRTDNLMTVQPRQFRSTTDSNHDYEVAHNLARYLNVTGPDQLWVADITYIRLRHEFVYLAVVLDAYSRRVIGWSLSRKIDTELTIAALERALAARKPAPGLVHHSDRGVQYASSTYARILKERGIEPSMSRPGNPYDNAGCESFMRTLKREEINANTYVNLEHLGACVGEFIEEYYNKVRLHSALAYLSPEAFEQSARRSPGEVATVRFGEMLARQKPEPGPDAP